MRALRVCTDTKAAAPASAKCVERVAPIFGNGLMTNAFEICQRNSRAGASTGNHNLFTICSLNRGKQGGAIVCNFELRAFNGQVLGL